MRQKASTVPAILFWPSAIQIFFAGDPLSLVDIPTPALALLLCICHARLRFEVPIQMLCLLLLTDIIRRKTATTSVASIRPRRKKACDEMWSRYSDGCRCKLDIYQTGRYIAILCVRGGACTTHVTGGWLCWQGQRGCRTRR